MKQEVAKLWAKALRSGEYKQGRGTLDHVFLLPDGKSLRHEYCCLGVLCAIAPKDLVEFADESDLGAKAQIFGENLQYQDPVMEWAGIADENGEIQGDPIDGGSKLLTELNDDRMWDFNDIADLIERRWEDL